MSVSVSVCPCVYAHHAQLRKRWQRSIPDVESRIVFVPRQPGSLPFLMLLALGDVALVPFPFGGSKTSLDSIAMGIPTVTMPTQHLRGRMTLSYYLSMGLASQCCVASSPATYVLVAWCVLVIVVVTLWVVDVQCCGGGIRRYVAMAAQLGQDARARAAVAEALRLRSQLVWERAEVALRWKLFLLTAVGCVNGLRDRAWVVCPPRVVTCVSCMCAQVSRGGAAGSPGGIGTRGRTRRDGCAGASRRVGCGAWVPARPELATG